MTKREMQIRENSVVENAYDEFKQAKFRYDYFKDLRSCSAIVYVSDRYFILQSYSTIIAVIDRRTNTLYDFLRFVYGYTATSAKHVAYFAHDYGCRERYTWKSV